jgi:hypothetical protein
MCHFLFEWTLKWSLHLRFQLSICFCTFCNAVFESQAEKEKHLLKFHNNNDDNNEEEEENVVEESLLGVSNLESENSVTTQPSSPEEFHGFTTPTKEMEQTKDSVARVRRSLSLS